MELLSFRCCGDVLNLFQDKVKRSSTKYSKTNNIFSFLFLLLSVIFIFIYITRLNCSIEKNAIGVVKVRTKSDCDNLLVVSCVNNCGSQAGNIAAKYREGLPHCPNIPEYTYFLSVEITDKWSCKNFFDLNKGANGGDISKVDQYFPIDYCTGVLHEGLVCQTFPVAVGIIFGYLYALFSCLQVVYSISIKMNAVVYMRTGIDDHDVDAL